MWNEKRGTYDSVIVSSYVEIKRNIKGFYFPCKLLGKDAEDVFSSVSDAGRKAGMDFVAVGEMSPQAAQFFCKGQYIRPEEVYANSLLGVLTGSDDEVFVRVNDADHLNVISRTVGGDIKKAYSKADTLAAALENNLDIAFSEKLGFLTSDHNLVGTGMRISLIISIPGISKNSKGIETLISYVERLGWEMIRYSKKDTNFMWRVVSNVTLGKSEEDIISDAGSIIDYINKYETMCRKEAFEKNTDIIEDQYYRAYATLRYARFLSSNEVLALCSLIRLGQDYVENNETGLTYEKINGVYFGASNSFADREPINVYTEENTNSKKIRAEHIRNILKED